MTTEKAAHEAVALLAGNDATCTTAMAQCIDNILRLAKTAITQRDCCVKVMQTLVAYIRAHAKPTAEPLPDSTLLALRADVRAAFDTLKQLYDRYAAELIAGGCLRRDAAHDDLSFAAADFQICA